MPRRRSHGVPGRDLGSGSPFDGTTAVGPTSGGGGDRASGRDFFQLATAALDAYGVSVG